MTYKPWIAAIFSVLLLFSGKATAACSNPAAGEGAIIYNTSNNLLQFCNGTDWINVGKHVAAPAESDPQVGDISVSGKWCQADGDSVECTFDAPSASGLPSGCASGVSIVWNGTAWTCDDPCTLNGGTNVGGHCWFLGATSQSCTTVCTNNGGTYAATTVSYAGSSGTDGNCQSIIAAIGGVSETWYMATACSGAYGCMVEPGDSFYRCTSPATNASAQAAFARRVCACTF